LAIDTNGIFEEFREAFNKDSSKYRREGVVNDENIDELKKFKW